MVSEVTCEKKGNKVSESLQKRCYSRPGMRPALKQLLPVLRSMLMKARRCFKSGLASSLSGWAVELGVSLVALTALLSIPKIHHSFLPKDGRSLLKTTNQYVLEKLSCGSLYCL